MQSNKSNKQCIRVDRIIVTPTIQQDLYCKETGFWVVFICKAKINLQVQMSQYLRLDGHMSKGKYYVSRHTNHSVFLKLKCLLFIIHLVIHI